jgi:hypothetical protein
LSHSLARIDSVIERRQNLRSGSILKAALILEDLLITLGWKYGYPAVLLLMGAVATGLPWDFKRSDWFD